MTPRESHVVDEEDETSMVDAPISRMHKSDVARQHTRQYCQFSALALPLNSPRVPATAARPLGLIFDLDGTLVAEPMDDHREHCLPDELFLRPGVRRFLAWCFERGHSLAVWTAAHAGWAHYVCWKLLQTSEDGDGSSTSTPRFEFVWDESRLKKRRRIPRDAHGLQTQTQDPASSGSASTTTSPTRCCWCGPYRSDCDRCECRLNRVFQCPCRFIKDLSKVWSKKKSIGGSFSRARTLIIENTPQQCLSNYGNAVYVPTYRGDQEDQVLHYLQGLILQMERVEDVRTVSKCGCAVSPGSHGRKLHACRAQSWCGGTNSPVSSTVAIAEKCCMTANSPTMPQQTHLACALHHLDLDRRGM